MMSYLLQINYFTKPTEDIKPEYIHFDTVFDIVGYLYNNEIDYKGKVKIFEEKTLSITLKDADIEFDEEE